MRQEHKDEAAVLIRRLAERTLPSFGPPLNLMKQLWELVDEVRRDLAEAP